MDEWGDLDARLERKKRIKLRRQQRELKKQQREMDALEKERQKLIKRCDEMAREDALSVAMMRFYKQQARAKRREIQRTKDMEVYATTATVRKRAQQLGLALETPGASGQERLDELRQRVETKEARLASALEAKQRLDALPKKRSRVRQLLESFFSSSTRAKLERAVYERRCDAIVELLDPKIPGKRADPRLLNHESENGLTPVLCAIFMGKLTLLRRLLELGASPDLETRAGITPLIACVLVDNVIALHILVEFGVNLNYETRNNVTALLYAADKGRSAILKALLRLGVSVDGANASGRSALVQAVISGSYETTKILLAHNANKIARDASGRSALEWAQHWMFDHIASLLNSTASSNSLLTVLNEQDELELDAPNPLVQEVITQRGKAPGTIAMETALQDGNVARILELLSVNDTGFGPNFETSAGTTPMLVVSEKGSSDDVLYCLERRCSASHANREGVNALMKAAYHGKEEIVQLLIRAGCSPWSRDIQGYDAIRYLHDNEHYDIARRLLKQFRTIESPRVVLSEPVQDIGALRSSMMKQSSRFDKSTNQPHGKDSECSDDDDHESDEASRDMTHAQLDADSANEWTKSHRWKIRRRALRSNTNRNASFESERQKVWKYAERGRRNGLIAPLPHDKAGRLKFPSCENCHGNRARKRCLMCDQVLCDRCHARLHELPHRRHHDFEELEPTLMVGTETHDVAVANQHDSLKGALERSLSCLNTMKQAMTSLPAPATQPCSTDYEVDKYQRMQRGKREKEIAQMQINVPVSAAKHAANAGEGDIYTNPADIELADLYIAQGKLAKARTLMETSKQSTEDSLGYSHPTVLKIHIRLARIEQHSGDLVRSISIICDALSTFESAVPPDNKDLVVAQDLTLQILDTLTDYATAVEQSRRIFRLRVIGLTASHVLIQQAHKNLDTFVAKRENALMQREDLQVLEQAAMDAARDEQRIAEQEQKRIEFRSMLLDQEPAERYDSFQAFAKKEFTEEMVQFWIAVEKAKINIDEQDARAFRAAVVAIFIAYIKSRRVKIITAVQRNKMKKAITTPGKKIPRAIFDEVQALVFDVIYNRVYARFEAKALTE